MPADQRGTPVYATSSNRAGWASNASQAGNGGLLAPGATKTLTLAANDAKAITAPPATPNPDAWQRPVDAPTVAAIASSLWIKNSSGQSAEFIFVVAHNAQGTQADVSMRALLLLDGESITINERILSIMEKNVGAVVQTGYGVRYYATLEPRYK